MFSKLSRYRKLPDAAAPDAAGRVLTAKDLRLLPDVTATFKHVVNAGDRLDQLAYKYYGQPLQWWNICDANPEFVSPLALLGQEPLVTTRFPVNAPAVPPWAKVLQALRKIVGVDKVDIAEDIELIPQRVTVSGQTITALTERYARAITVTYNRVNVSATSLAIAIEAVGFQVSPYVDLDQVGQEILIPPKPIG
jgi:hypothetical protein